jgi:hypothetical protein
MIITSQPTSSTASLVASRLPFRHAHNRPETRVPRFMLVEMSLEASASASSARFSQNDSRKCLGHRISQSLD